MNFVSDANATQLFTKVGNTIAGTNGLVKDTVGWTGKNLMPVKAQSLPNAVDFAVDSDGYVYHPSGVTDNRSWEYSNCNSFFTLQAGTYFIKCFEKTAQTDGPMGLCIIDSSSNTILSKIGADNFADLVSNGASFTINSKKDIGVEYKIGNGKYGFLVMDARISDKTYEPHHESVDACKYNRSEANVLGAKNLVKPSSVASGTDNGVAYTNTDGIVTANNQATADSKFSWDIGHLPVGKYRITGCPSGGSASKYCVRVGVDTTASGWGSYVQADYGDGAEFEVDDATKFYSIGCRVFNGYTASSLVFKPMIALASDTDSTYAPYAMTNRELTTDKLDIATLKSIASSSADFAAFKTAIAAL